MKKLLAIILLTSLLYAMSGCGQDTEDTVIENPYFPVQEHVSLKVHTEYYGQESVDKTADAEIDRVKVYENGSIYRFTVFNTPMLDIWPWAI